MRRFILSVLVLASLFIGACTKKTSTVEVIPTVEQTVEVIEAGE